MKSYVSLKHWWSHQLDRMVQKDREQIVDLFYNILGIRNVTPQDIISELAELSRSPEAVPYMKSRVDELYSTLLNALEPIQELFKTITK